MRNSRIQYSKLVENAKQLEYDTEIFFKRKCDLYGWGMTKIKIFSESFLFLMDYTEGVAHPINLPADYQNTDYLNDTIWSCISRHNSTDKKIYLITEGQAEKIGYLNVKQKINKA